MILHLVTKHFVSNDCLSVFEKRAQGQNIILVLCSMPNSVASVNNAVKVSVDNEKEIVDSLDFTKISHVVIHYLTPITSRFVQKYLPEEIPIYWWTYGGDLYQPFLEMRGYDLFYNDLTPFKPGWFYMLSRFTRTIINRTLFKIKVFHGDDYYQTDLLDRIDGIIPCIPPDHEMACKYLKRDYKLVRIHPSGQHTYDEGFYNENVISIGHSASVSDNHLYALKYLSKIDIADAKVILTLSYNIGSKRYVEGVKARYKKIYDNNVSFIETRISKEDYYKSQNTLDVMIIPTWRQEALANIVSGFLRGVKLFLSNKGPMYNHFKDYGLKLFAIEDINQDIYDTPLPLEDKIHNRQLIIRYLGEKEKLIDEDFKLYFGEYLVDNK